jgi:hypothetical protein
MLGSIGFWGLATDYGLVLGNVLTTQSIPEAFSDGKKKKQKEE